MALRILNDATSQQDRLNTAPAPESVQVDGRDLADLLAFAPTYGALIQFYDLQNQPDGDWSALFGQDPAIALAMHVALDLPRMEAAVRDLLASLTAPPHHHHLPKLHKLLAVIARLLGILDRRAHHPHAAETELRHRADRSGSDALSMPLRHLHRHLDAPDLATAWRHHGHRRDWYNRLVQLLEDLAAALLDALAEGAAAARAALKDSLNSHGHAPQAALYNAFVQLFIQSRQVLNQFPRRLLDFYYSEVLRQETRAAEPDRVFLTFTTAAGVTHASVPHGTQFPAGTDAANQPIVYAAEAPLAVTDAQIAELSLHRLSAGGGIFGDDGPPTDVLSGLVALAGDDAANAGAPFPLFGANVPGPYGSLTLTPATLGFSLTSPILLLTGGVRQVSIGLTLQTAIDPDQQAQAAAMPSAAHMAELIASSFSLAYSTAGGWVPVQHFTVSPATQMGVPSPLTVNFILPADAPPFVALSTPAQKDAPAAPLAADTFPDPGSQPALNATFKAVKGAVSSAHDPYAVLSRIVVSDLSIGVTVTGLSALTLSTPNGPVDNGVSFPVLGSPPVQGATLTIHAAELFVKPLTSLSVAVTWVGLPVTSTGFKGYYQGYTTNADGDTPPPPLFDNTSFGVCFSVANPGLWTLDDTQVQNLFQTQPPPGVPTVTAPDAPVLATSVLTAPGVGGMTAPPYYAPESSALCVTLASPAYAFGNILYTANLTTASLAQAQSMAGSLTVPGTPRATVQDLALTNDTAPEKTYAQTMTEALEAAISSLNGQALAALQQAVAASPGANQPSFRASLQTALAGGNASGSWLWNKLKALFAGKPTAATVTANLRTWLDDNAAELGTAAKGPLTRAASALTAAGGLDAARKATKASPVAIARPTMAASLQSVLSQLRQPAVQQAGAPPPPADADAEAVPKLPNPPWLPMASLISVSYTARVGGSLAAAANAARVVAADQAMLSGESSGQFVPEFSPATLASVGSVSPTGGAAASTAFAAQTAAESPAFFHVAPFGQLQAPRHGNSQAASLVPVVEPHAALYIKLSAVVNSVSLLFILGAAPDGWSSEQPQVVWEQHIAGEWPPLLVLGDTTNGLLNSGIVTLQLLTPRAATSTPRLRVRALRGADNTPLVTSVTTNALTACWIGPGGAAQLGSVPLAADTISKSSVMLPGIFSIAQPLESFGGRPADTGAAFDGWMAERLRHKGFGIAGWDYARLVLEQVPSVWQVAVVPGAEAISGAPAPGAVWVVAIAGPTTPNVTDPTIPSVDATTLGTIGDYLLARISPFIRLRVTNPPYLRLQVTAKVLFSGGNTADFWTETLQQELVLFLSPWPPPKALGPRPADYYTRQAVAEFIRGRSYVQGVAALSLDRLPPDQAAGCYYLTSALNHAITPMLDTAPAPGAQVVAAVS